MLTLQQIKEDPERVIARLAVKGFDGKQGVNDVIDFDDERKNLQFQNDNIAAQLKKKADSIGRLMKEGNKAEAEEAKKEVAEMKEKQKELAERLATTENAIRDILLGMPNIPCDMVPEGRTAEDNVVEKTGGQMPELPADALPHWDLAKKYDLINFDLGVKITGPGFPVYVGKGAKIGRGAKIYPQVYIGDGCEVGEDAILYAGVKVYAGCVIGNRCIVHSGAVIGADGFGFAPSGDGHYEKIPQTGNVVLEDDVEIGANTTVDRAMMGSTRICKGVKLDNLIQVAHNCHIGDNTVMAAQVGLAGSSKIGKQCMVGGQVGIVGHIAIADGTQIGAQSGVNRATKPGERIMGAPAVEMGEYARSLVYVKRLGKLFEQVKNLEKEIKKQ